MKIRFTLIVLAALLTGAAHGTEREALTAFYEAMGGTHWDQAEGWLTEFRLDDWHGVEVAHGHVVSLALPDNNLTGELTDALAKLTHLERLDLRWNAIGGDIPESLSWLLKAKEVLLSGNNLTGAIPEAIGSMPALTRLDLSYNGLTGEIPAALGELNSLRSIGLQHNRLSGAIPQSMGNIGTLQRVIVNNNDLYGSLPSGFGDIDGLHLNLAGNAIERAGTDIKGATIAITRKSARSLYGVDVLGETTRIMHGDHASDFITDVMRAIEVRDGFLYLHTAILPDTVDAQEVQALIDGMNQRLEREGETIQSVSDLERVLELYSPGTVEIPDPDGTGGFHFEPDALAPSDKGIGAIEAKRFGGPNQQRGGADCTRNIQHPHATYRNNIRTIVGKYNGRCWVVYGPTDLTYSLRLDLARWYQTWFLSDWVVMWSRGPFVRNSDPSVWSNQEVDMFCRDGKYRVQSRMYVTSASLGNYRPYPGHNHGGSRNIEC